MQPALKPASKPALKPASQPNILILMADQLTARALAAYGNPVTSTPHIDALAAAGVVFDSAYCNSPLCAPARYALMTGTLPSANGGYDNAAALSSDAVTFAHYLRHAGYRTILSGKMHFCGADQLHGFEERLTTDIYPADFGWTPDWTQPDVRPDWYHNMSSVTDAGHCARSNQLDFDDEVVFAARQKLFDLARDPDRRPFCMTVAMTHPHDPYAICSPYWEQYSDDEIDMPRVPEAPAGDDPHSRRLRAVIGLDQTPVTPAQTRRARRAYYGAISYVDEQIGVLLRALRESGQADDTVIIVTSDHGDMLGERGLWYKMNFFEPASRVPLIVHAPPRFQPHRVAESVSLVDLLPTLLDLAHAGATPPAGAAFPLDIAGRSLLPHLTRRGGHDGVAAEYLAEGALAPIVMLRQGAWKFIHSPADPDQLYHLGDDPDELHNLASDPASADVLARFRADTARRWDLPALHRQVLASQARRRFIGAANALGAHHAWDYEPPRDASKRYIRNHLDLDALEARARLSARPGADA
ncbi:choline-sulfatase [Duganella sp. CF517]|nr:choline-sulfatase [Duganella sp. CF517]